MLKIWMPLNKDLRNAGLIPFSNPTNTGMTIQNGNSPFGNGFGNGGCVFHCDENEFGDTWTIATWAKSASWTPSGSNDIISCKNSSASTYCHWYFSQVGKALNIAVNSGSGGLQVQYTFENETWYHLAASFDGHTSKLYVNGDFIGSGTVTNAPKTGCTNIGVGCRATNNAGTAITEGGRKQLCDFRIYDNVLKDWEIKKLASKQTFEMETNLHLKAATNIGGSSILYKGKNYGQEYSASSWGGDAGKIKFFKDGGYGNLPYKEYHKTASGTGGMYLSQTKDIPIQSGKTYTMSIYVKSNREFTDSAHAFNINGAIPGDSNHYITYGKNVPFTTEWNRISRTFTATTAETGNFTEMSILYNNAVLDYYVYYSGFQIEEGKELSPFTIGHRDERFVDSSGLGAEFEPYNIVQSGSSLYFNGVDSAIKIPLHEMISAGTWSINIWFYRPNGEFGNKRWETLIGGQTGFELSSSSADTKTPNICPYSWGGGKYAYEMDKWNMVTLVRTSSGSKVYLNGELIKSGSAGSMPEGDYFIGAWKTYNQQNFKGYMKRFSVYKTALTEEEVKALYINNE